MSKGPALIVLSNDLPDSAYGAEHLADAFRCTFDVRIADPTRGFGGADAWLARESPEALVLSGSDRSVLDATPWMLEEQEIVRLATGAGLPVLGVCFGHQLIAVAFGAALERKTKRVAVCEIRVTADDPMLGPAGLRLRMPEQHSEHVVSVPAGFVALASSDGCRIEAMRHETAPVYGVQFHPCYEADVIDVDEAWEGHDAGAFRHDGAGLLRRAARYFETRVRG